MANGQQIQVGIKFTADTAQAKQQIQTLQNTLQQISNTSITVQGGGIEQAVQAANQLHVALQNAVNVDTGKINFIQLSNNLKSAGTDLNQISSKLLSLGPEGQKAFSQLSSAVAASEIPIRKTNSALAAFGDTLLRTIRWQVASSLIHGFMSTVSQAVSYIENLNKSLNSIQIVTQKSDIEMANFVKTANKAAGELSAVTKEYTDASLIFFQQGLDTKEVIERTNATVKLAKVTGDSIDAVSSKLTAIWNNFDDGTQSLEYYVDVITALGASTAASSDEIATGLQKFSAVADTVGLSYEKATAALATVVAQTRQSADVVGTSFKTIFARIEGLKLGETLDDGVTLNQYSSALAKIGVNILDSNNELKDMDTILDDIGERWNKISKAQQVALAQTVGGLRQYQQFIAMMDNYDKVLENQNIAENSTGTLQKQFDVYQNSLEATNKELEKAKQDLYDELFSTDNIKDFKNILIDVFGTVKRIVDGFGGLKGIIIFIGTLLMQRIMPSLMAGFTNIYNKVISFSTMIHGKSNSPLSQLNQMQESANEVANGNTATSIGESININGGIGKATFTSEEQNAAYEQEILELKKYQLETQGALSEEAEKNLKTLINELEIRKQEAVQSKEKLENTQKQSQELQKQAELIAHQVAAKSSDLPKSQLIIQGEQRKDQIDYNQEFSINNFVKGKGEGLRAKFEEDIQAVKKAYEELLETDKTATEQEKQNWQDKIKLIDDYLKKSEQVKGRPTKDLVKDANELRSNLVKDNNYNNYNMMRGTDYSSEQDPGTKTILSDATNIFGANNESANDLLEIMKEVGIVTEQIKENANEFANNLSEGVIPAKDLSQIFNVSEKSLNMMGKQAGNLKVQANNYKSIATDIKTMLPHLKKVGTESKEITNYSNKISTFVKQATKENRNFTKEVQKAATELKKSSNAGSELVNKIEQLNKGENVSFTTDELEILQKTFENTGMSAEKTANTLIKFGNTLIESLNIPEDKKQQLRELLNIFNELPQAEDRAASGAKRFGESMNKPMGNLGTFATSLKTVAQNATTAIMGFQMMIASVDSLSSSFSEGISLLDLLSQGFMALRAAMMIANAVETITIQLKKAHSATHKKRMREMDEERSKTDQQTASDTAGAASKAMKKSVEEFGAVAGLIAGVAAVATIIGAVAIAAGKKSSGAASKLQAEQAKAAAENSQKAAEEAKNEYEQIKQNLDEYNKLYNEYLKTGTGKEKLYESSMELVKVYELENGALLALSGSYDDIIAQLKEKAKLELEEKQRADTKNLEKQKTVVETSLGNDDNEFGGYQQTDNGEIGFKTYTWSEEYQRGAKETSTFGRGKTAAEYDFYIMALAAGWNPSTNQSALDYMREKFNYATFDEGNIGQVSFSKTSLAGLEQFNEYVELTNQILGDMQDNLEDRDKVEDDIFDIDENNRWQHNLLTTLAKSFNVDIDKYDTSQDILDKLKEEAIDKPALQKLLQSSDVYSLQIALQDDLGAIQDTNSLISLLSLTGTTDDLLLKAIGEAQSNGQQEGIDKLKENYQASLDNAIDVYSAGIEYSNTITDLYDLLDENSEGYKTLSKDYAKTKYNDEEAELTEEDKKYIQNRILSMAPTYLQHLYTIGTGLGLGKEDLEDIVKSANMSYEELDQYFQNLGNNKKYKIGFYTDSNALINQIKQDLEVAQKQADSDPIEVQYNTSKDAAKDWKKNMTFSELLNWQEKYQETLFGENGILTNKGITFEEFYKKSYKEQIELLNNAITNEDIIQERKNTYENAKKTQEEFSKGNIYNEETDEIFTQQDYLTNTLNNALDGFLTNNEKNNLIENYLNSLIEHKGQIVESKMEALKRQYGEERAEELADYLIKTYNNMYTDFYEDPSNIIRYFSEEALEKAAHQETYKSKIDTLGLNEEEVYNYIELLERTTDLTEEEREQIALLLKAQEKGFKDATDHLEDYNNILKNTNRKQLPEYINLLKQFQNELKLLFGRENLDLDVSEKIFNDTEAMRLFNKAITEHSDEAFKQFQVRSVMLELNIDPNTTELDEYLLEMANKDIEVGMNLDDTEIINFFNFLLRTGQITAEELKNSFADISYVPEFDGYDAVTITQENAHLLSNNNTLFDSQGNIIDNTKAQDEYLTNGSTTVYFPRIKGAKKISLPNPASSLTPPSDKGGSSRSPKELKKSTDEIDRYHVVDKTIDSLSKKYSRLSAAKDAAFGKERLKYIEQENKLLQQQYKAEKDRLKEVEKYYAEDRAAIEAYGAKIDNNGVITNYDQIMQQQLDKLNSKYEQYNAGGLSDEIIEAAEKDYEDFKKILSQFEETNSTYLDQLKKVEDAIREQLSHELEAIKAKVELELELPDEQIKLIEFKLQDLENRAFKSAEKIALWGDKAEQAASKFNSYLDGFKEFLSMGIEDEEGNLLGGFNLTDEQIEAIMHGNMEALKEAGVTGDNANEIIEALKEYEDNLIETYQTIVEMRSSIEEELFNQLSEYTEAIETQINKLDKLNSITNNIKTLMGTVGKETLGITSEIIKQIDRNIAAANKSQIQIMRKEQESLQISLDEAKQKLQEAITRNDTEAIEYWKKANTEIENQLLDTTDNLFSKINDFVEQMVENISQTIQDGFNDFAKSIYGMTLEDAQASYDRYKTLSDDYLKDYQKIYELSKLTRNIEKSINDTDNLNAKQRLRDLQEEINKYQAEGVQMTKYEVDYLTKKYELRQAEIALQDAQNAKDQVRLSRNADGGWGYIYTANQDNIDKAQQTYEDKLYALQELNQQTIEETQSTILQLQKEFEDAILETIQNTNLSEKEKQARISELQQYYLQRMQIYYNTLNTALNNNREVYEKDWAAYNQLIGYRISADKDYIDKFNETWLGQQTGLIAGITTVEEAFQMYQEGLGSIDGDGVLGETYAALEEYEQNINNLLGEVGLSGQISNYMDIISGKIEEADNAGSVLATTLGEELPDTINQIDDFQKKFNDRIEKMKNSIEKANEAVRTLIAYLSGLDDVDFGVNINASITASGLKDQVVNAIRETVQEKYLTDPNKDDPHGNLGGGGALEHLEGQSQVMFDTGGYTGEWGPDGRLAMLHEKELVLNKDDTENMLKMVNLVRDTVNTISLGSQLNAYKATLLGKHQISTNNISQSVSIEAHFPNVVNHLEIEEAFNNLVNYAAQSAYNFDLPDQINIF